jgi:hypothetical protein
MMSHFWCGTSAFATIAVRTAAVTGCGVTPRHDELPHGRDDRMEASFLSG